MRKVLYISLRQLPPRLVRVLLVYSCMPVLHMERFKAMHWGNCLIFAGECIQNGHVNWAADHIATCSHSKLILLFLFHHLYILPVVGYHGITLTKDLCLTLWYSFPFHPLLGRQQDRRAKGLAPTKSKLVGLLHCPVCSCGTCNNLDSMSFCLKRHNLPAKERVPHQTLSLYRCQTTCHKTYQIYQMNVSE